ncbi:hypothetical protein H4R34_004856 [Dimargaris verticillata]|uniref:R3H-associated N-terminal domain-containing protein n=1 Tax=Dimargaris verticillata TaxID=2761393 RepID=A0A9W8EAS3_9FUNG|nr:hypothetical protein H4R34_004856 [Dimargaris verticillata]
MFVTTLAATFTRDPLATDLLPPISLQEPTTSKTVPRPQVAAAKASAAARAHVKAREATLRSGRRHLRRLANAQLLDHPMTRHPRDAIYNTSIFPEPQLSWSTYGFHRASVRRVLLADMDAISKCDPMPWARMGEESHTNSMSSHIPPNAAHPIAQLIRRRRAPGRHFRHTIRHTSVTADFIQQYEQPIIDAMHEWFGTTMPQESGRRRSLGASTKASIDSLLPLSSLDPLAAEMTTADPRVAQANSNEEDGEGDEWSHDWDLVESAEAGGLPVVTEEIDPEDLVIVSHQPAQLSDYRKGTTLDLSAPLARPQHTADYLCWETNGFVRLIIHTLSNYYGLQSHSRTGPDGVRRIYVSPPIPPTNLDPMYLSMSLASSIWPDQTMADYLFQ